MQAERTTTAVRRVEKETFMATITAELRAEPVPRALSRRTTLRGLGGVGLAALTLGLPGRATATTHYRATLASIAPSVSDDPAALIDAYVAAVNAGDLEAILALHADEAVHIFLPTPDGSAGVCRGKDQFRLWYEQSVANGDQVEVVEGTLAVDGNQAAFLSRIASNPWRDLGLEALEASAQIVVIDGQIMTHVVTLAPDAVRRLQSAREASAVPALIFGDAWASTQQYPGLPH